MKRKEKNKIKTDVNFSIKTSWLCLCFSMNLISFCFFTKINAILWAWIWATSSLHPVYEMRPPELSMIWYIVKFYCYKSLFVYLKYINKGIKNRATICNCYFSCVWAETKRQQTFFKNIRISFFECLKRDNKEAKCGHLYCCCLSLN